MQFHYTHLCSIVDDEDLSKVLCRVYICKSSEAFSNRVRSEGARPNKTYIRSTVGDTFESKKALAEKYLKEVGAKEWFFEITDAVNQTEEDIMIVFL